MFARFIGVVSIAPRQQPPLPGSLSSAGLRQVQQFAGSVLVASAGALKVVDEKRGNSPLIADSHHVAESLPHLEHIARFVTGHCQHQVVKDHHFRGSLVMDLFNLVQVRGTF